MPGADGMSSKFMKNAFVGWTFTAGLYYPPDFDQSKLMPMKMIKPKEKQQSMNIRMMFPFTMICDTCNEYNYTGTKFTSKCEQIKQEEYLGIKVYRFYGRCKHCYAEFTFKTDPKNSDYTMESGGKRTYEAWKDADMVEAQMKQEKERDIEQDQMKALEQKSIDVQAEMQRIEDLDAIRTMNKRLSNRDQTIEETLKMIFEREEQAAVDAKAPSAEDNSEVAGFKAAQEERKRQLMDKELEEFGEKADEASTAAAASSSSSGGASGSAGSGAGPAVSATDALVAKAVAERQKEQAAKKVVGAKFSVKRKAPEAEGAPAKKAAAPAAEEGGGGLGCLGGYDSSES
mmetsp:Transcript_57218/g.167988  ORF Transcript_57218/g.167988 Transcript_57218/m.167988 type:complete len:344 (-) Transcript_57218:112-1143(-)